MTFFIRRCLIFFMIFEGLVFFMVYCFGPQGITTLFTTRTNIQKIQKNIIDLEIEIQKLQNDIAYYQTEFAQEQIAREVLLMKQPDETTYFV